MLTHIPAADWCEYCVRGKAVALGHRRVPVERRQEKPVIELLNSFLQASGDFINDPARAVATTLPVRDNSTGLGMTISLPAKTQPLKYIRESIAAFIDSLGHPQVTIPTDGEPSIKLVAEEIKTAREAKGEHRTALETTLRYSSQSLGGVGQSQKALQGDVLTLRYFLEG